MLNKAAIVLAVSLTTSISSMPVPAIAGGFEENAPCWSQKQDSQKCLDQRMNRTDAWSQKHTGTMTGNSPAGTTGNVQKNECVKNGRASSNNVHQNNSWSPSAGSYQMKDGGQVIVDADGTKHFHGADGSEKVMRPDGSGLWRRADGSQIEKFADGHKIFRTPDGQEKLLPAGTCQ